MKKLVMGKIDAGKVLLWILGGAISFLPIFGETPMVLSFFASAFIAGTGRWLVSLLLALILVSKGLTLETIRYLTIGMSFCFIWKMTEARGNGHKKWLGSVYIAGIFMIVGISGELMSFSGNLTRLFVVFEGLFIMGISLLLNQIGGYVPLPQREVACQAEVLQSPGREKMLESSRALKKLSRTFFGMPGYKETLNHQDMEKIFEEVADQVCRDCGRYKQCWVIHTYGTFQATEQLFYEEESAATVSFLDKCLRPQDYQAVVRDLYGRAKTSLVWENRLQESRDAVGAQLLEMSDFISDMAEEIYGKEDLDDALLEQLKKALLSMKIEWIDGKGYRNCHGNPELLLYLRAKKGYSLSVRDVEKKVSHVLGLKMTALRDGRRVINSEVVFLHFVQEISYKYLYGVAKSVKDNEVISGDNFTITLQDDGQMLMGLSDGMGSGVQASKDSEAVMDLIEQFFEAGFHKETAVNLLNSTWLAKGMEPGGATLDLCTIDLYRGTFEMLKQGAAASFILERGKVRIIRGQALPMGICTRGGFELFKGEFGKEAYVIMVSDGVLDAFWQEDGEKAIEELLLYEDQKNPKLLANTILEEALIASNGRARDDMTVLVLGLWKKE